MQTIFSTAGVPPADAFTYWQDTCDKILRPDYIEAIDRKAFYAHIETEPLGDLAVTSWEMAPLIARNTNGEDMLRSGDSLLLLCPNSRIAVELADHSHEFNDTNLCLFDIQTKHVSQALHPINLLGVGIPCEALARRVRISKEIINQPIAAQGEAALLAGLVREIIRIGPSSLSPAAAALVREQMLDLAAVALGNLAGLMPRLGAASRLATLKLRAAIDRQLANPDADRHSIAAAAGISERHANRLLALEGTSIRRLLTERRLNKSREAIANPLQRQRSISDIAFAHGFRDLSHFTHAFKDRFGLAPREYRIAFCSSGTIKSRAAK